MALNDQINAEIKASEKKIAGLNGAKDKQARKAEASHLQALRARKSEILSNLVRTRLGLPSEASSSTGAREVPASRNIGDASSSRGGQGKAIEANATVEEATQPKAKVKTRERIKARMDRMVAALKRLVKRTPREV